MWQGHDGSVARATTGRMHVCAADAWQCCQVQLTCQPQSGRRHEGRRGITPSISFQLSMRVTMTCGATCRQLIHSGSQGAPGDATERQTHCMHVNLLHVSFQFPLLLCRGAGCCSGSMPPVTVPVAPSEIKRFVTLFLKPI